MKNKVSTLEKIMYGACFLASGGGGSLEMIMKLVRSIGFGDDMPIISPAEVEDGKFGALLAGIGSPTSTTRVKPEVIAETLLNTYEALGKKCGENGEGIKLSYIIPLETGTANILVPIMAAYINNSKDRDKIFVIDGDGAGRAIPQIDMASFSHKVPISPVIISNVAGTSGLEICGNEPGLIDSCIRGAVATDEFGNNGCIACWKMGKSQIKNKDILIPGTLTRAKQVGEIFIDDSKESKEDAVLEYFEKDSRSRAFLLIKNGTVVDFEKVTRGGFDFGKVRIRDNEKELLINFQNENLIAFDSRKSSPVAIAPDSICYITSEGLPCSNADMEKVMGKSWKVSVIGISAFEQIRTKKVTSAFLESLKAHFGYGGTYVPIEKLNSKIPIS